MSDDWPSAGTLLATRYRLVALLETGGMAQIWHATDELLARPVAIKLPTGPQIVWREARMAAKLSHPGIAAVHDYREAVRADGTVAPFVVMELLSGETVAAHLVRENFSWQETSRVGAAVAAALAAAHASGVVHRDIKPGNVMLTPAGVKILDFGISATAGEPDDDDTGATFGTPAYVAPERLDGMPAEPATDVYGLGVLMFEMVTGQPPYPVETWEELDKARTEGPDTLPGTLPADFRAVVERCLSESPDDRPQADEVRFTLTALWLADQPEKPAADEPEKAAGEPAEPSAAQSAPAASGPTPAASVSPAPAGSADRPRTGARRPGGHPPTRPGGHPPTEERPTGVPPRVAEIWSRPRPGAAEPGFAPGRAPGYASGRAAAATLPMNAPPPRRRLALVLAVLALLAAAGGIYAVVSRPREKPDAAPPATSHPATLFYSRQPATAAPTTKPTTAAPTSASPSPKLSFDDAVSRLRAAVEDGAASGDIRGDVATDLLNLIRPLQNADAKDVDAQVATLRRKINERAGEGSLTPAQATVLRSRLTDLDRAAGM